MIDITFTTKEIGILQCQTLLEEKYIYIDIYAKTGMVIAFETTKGRMRDWHVYPKTGYWNRELK